MPHLHSETWRHIRRLLAYLPVGLRRRCLVALAVSVFPGILDAVSLAVVGAMMASLLHTRIKHGIDFPPLMHLDQTSRILLLTAAFIVLSWLRSACMVLFLVLQETTAGRLWRWLGDTLYERILCQPYEFHLLANDKKLGTQVLANSNLVVKGVFAPMLKAHSALASVCFVLVGLVYVGRLSSIVILATLFILYAGGSVLLTAHLRRAASQQLRMKSAMKQEFLESLHLIREIRLASAENFFLDRFRIHSKTAKQVDALSHLLPMLPKQVIEPLGISLIFMLGTVPALFANGNQADLAKILPLLATLALASQRITRAVNDLFMALTRLRASLPNLSSLLQYLELPSPQVTVWPAESPSQRSRCIDFHDSVCLRDVTYSYPGRDVPVIAGLTLSISAGSCVGLVGSTGSGKSTLAHLLLGILSPQCGFLEVDGQVINSHNTRAWQSHCAYVPQNPRFLRGSLLENIAFAQDPLDVNLERIWHAINQAQLGDVVESLPGGLQTQIGIDGLHLSGGQRQRLAIARAFYNEAEFLMLDEPTSALDNSTELQLLDAVIRAAQQCTVVIISHRLAAISRCEKVYLLSAGTLQPCSGPEYFSVC